MWIFFPLLFLLLIIGIALLIVWIVRQSGRYKRRQGEESLLEILKKRYARGEISKDEFETMKKDIL